MLSLTSGDESIVRTIEWSHRDRGMRGTGILRSRTERLAELVSAHPVLSVFLVALVARLLAVLLVTFVLPDGWLALDDGTYTQLAADRAAGRTAQ
jgi:hypothetical protein